MNIETQRHSLAHIMATAVMDMFPEAKLGIGPDIENGFYYDFDLPRTLQPEDLPIIEKKMKGILSQAQKFEKYTESIDDAIKFLKTVNQNYTAELAENLKIKGETEVSFYKNGNFVNMCRGPHVEHTGKVTKNFKLISIAGAYWRGDSSRPMLQRIYAVAFDKKEELDAYLKMVEEAKKRDHKILGKKLDLFSFHEEGQGFPFFHAKGMRIINKLLEYWREEHRKCDYEEIKTPIILNRKLWETSGHWANYRENMYTTEIDEVEHAIKPMNCPGGIIVYKTKEYSYRDLPLRAGELGLVHRHELSGVLNGLFRVRNFTQDDAHIFCTPDQIKDELIGVIDLVFKMYKTFGYEKIDINLSTRPEKSVGSDEIWEMAENALKGALEEKKIDYVLNEGDGAFYGPKIDFIVSDALGRKWQCGTVQLDFNLPERFELEYKGADGESHRPVMLHRVIYGSMERFLGILIEHYAGAFPFWLAPVQIAILPVAETHEKYAKELFAKWKNDYFTEYHDSSLTLGKRIRNAEMQKIPFMIVIGDNEVEGKKVTVRSYEDKSQKEMDIKDFENMMEKLTKERK